MLQLPARSCCFAVLSSSKCAVSELQSHRELGPVIKRTLFGVAVFSALAFAQSQNSGQQANAFNFAGDLANAPFRNSALPIDERVNDLVSRMHSKKKCHRWRTTQRRFRGLAFHNTTGRAKACTVWGGAGTRPSFRKQLDLLPRSIRIYSAKRQM